MGLTTDGSTEYEVQVRIGQQGIVRIGSMDLHTTWVQVGVDSPDSDSGKRTADSDSGKRTADSGKRKADSGQRQRTAVESDEIISIEAIPPSI